MDKSNKSGKLSFLAGTVMEGNRLSIERNEKAGHFYQPSNRPGVVQYSQKVFPQGLDADSYEKVE